MLCHVNGASREIRAVLSYSKKKSDTFVFNILSIHLDMSFFFISLRK